MMRVGDWVLVTAGPFKGGTGYVRAVVGDQVKVAVGLLHLTLDLSDVEPIEAKGVVKA